MYIKTDHCYRISVPIIVHVSVDRLVILYDLVAVSVLEHVDLGQKFMCKREWNSSH